MKILVFLHGTIIMHKSGIDKTPQERGDQVLDKSDETIFDFINYIPIGKANEILRYWSKNNNKIIYMSSHRNKNDVKKDIAVLENYAFPSGKVLYRGKFSGYKKLVEKEAPDIIIEDDCKCIAKMIKNKCRFLPNKAVAWLTEREMVYPHLPDYLKQKIQSVVLEEFEGIDNMQMPKRKRMSKPPSHDNNAK